MLYPTTSCQFTIQKRYIIYRLWHLVIFKHREQRWIAGNGSDRITFKFIENNIADNFAQRNIILRNNFSYQYNVRISHVFYMTKIHFKCNLSGGSVVGKVNDKFIP